MVLANGAAYSAGFIKDLYDQSVNVNTRDSKGLDA